MAYQSPSLTGVMLLVVPAIGVSAAAYGRYIKRLSKEVQEKLGGVNALVSKFCNCYFRNNFICGHCYRRYYYTHSMCSSIVIFSHSLDITGILLWQLI